MKKVLILSALLVTAVALMVNAAIHRSQSFINGTGVWITNNTTHLFTDTNIVYTNSSGVVVQSTNAAHWVDVSGYADLNGNPASVNMSVKWTGTNVNSSNILTFKLVRSGDGTNFDTQLGTEPASWSFATTPLGTTSGSITTNLPTWFLTGTARIRLFSVAVSSVGSSGTLILHSARLNGFVP